jgi:hypothetical protein
LDSSMAKLVGISLDRDPRMSGSCELQARDVNGLKRPQLEPMY